MYRKPQFLTTSQAFKTVLDRASSNISPNPTADDVRIMVSMNYLLGDANFPVLNQALYQATKGNWTAFNYTAFASIYTSYFMPLVPIYCLDYRGYCVIKRTCIRCVLITIILDIDDNTFNGFNKIRQASVTDDPARIEYIFFLALQVGGLL